MGFWTKSDIFLFLLQGFKITFKVELLLNVSLSNNGPTYDVDF